MIVEPYKLHPVAPRVALLLGDGQAVDEDGELLDLDAWPQGTRLWAAYETVYRLVREGRGEALCWRGEEIRWRHRRFEETWVRRPSDANVVRLPFSHLRPESQLSGFSLWRDWLGSRGASPTGTSGSAAWSLLRATLDRRLLTGSGERPPIGWTVGGRQQLGPLGAGMYTGRLEHLDLPAAYASTLAGLRYGGVWLQHEPRVAGRDVFRYAGGDYPVFVRAQVRVPDGFTGPLLRRPRRRPGSYLEAQVLANEYPAPARLQGVWTYEEVAAAEASGCRVRILDGWVHRSGWQPFLPWWDAIQEGRALGGLAGSLAKVTGNALWGRFCLDDRAGTRFIRSLDRRGRTAHRALQGRSSMFPAHDLAETVSGRVRAKLWQGISSAAGRLVLADTDGYWALDETGGSGVARTGEMPPVSEPPVSSSVWRTKGYARRLDVLLPQCYREWPLDKSRGPWVTFAGVPAELAPGVFDERWKAAAEAARTC